MYTAALGTLAAAMATLALQLARWHVDGLQRTELIKAIEERRKYSEERDHLLVELREEIKAAQEKLLDLAHRLEREEMTGNDLLREQVVRDRYIRLLQAQIRRSGGTVPPEPEDEVT